MRFSRSSAPMFGAKVRSIASSALHLPCSSSTPPQARPGTPRPWRLSPRSGALHRRVDNIRLRLHEIIVGACAAVHLQRCQTDAGIGLHGSQNVVGLVAQAVQGRADDVIFVDAPGQSHDDSPGVLIPMGCAQTGEGRDDVAAVGIGHLGRHVLRVGEESMSRISSRSH